MTADRDAADQHMLLTPPILAAPCDIDGCHYPKLIAAQAEIAALRRRVALDGAIVAEARRWHEACGDDERRVALTDLRTALSQ